MLKNKNASKNMHRYIILNQATQHHIGLDHNIKSKLFRNFYKNKKHLKTQHLSCVYRVRNF